MLTMDRVHSESLNEFAGQRFSDGQIKGFLHFEEHLHETYFPSAGCNNIRPLVRYRKYEMHLSAGSGAKNEVVLLSSHFVAVPLVQVDGAVVVCDVKKDFLPRKREIEF